MYFKYILFLTLAVASNGMLNTSLSSGAQEDKCKDVGPWKRFGCEDGKCILDGDVCDLCDDCEDGSDENNCTNHVCGSDEFRCQSGQCFIKRCRCDGRIHCADGSDEINCVECSQISWDGYKTPFKCVSNNKCINWFQQCDSIKDCPDGSDEDEVTCQNLECAEGMVKCKAGHCVRRDWDCAGYDPCVQDYDPEKLNLTCLDFQLTLECPLDLLSCKTDNKCIKNSMLCDMVPDCEDGSDESECSVRKCGLYQFQCQSGQCVNHYQGYLGVCDGVPDCEDKSDEANCTSCSLFAFKCGSGECVHEKNICNSIPDCSDGSDEDGIKCPHGPTPPALTPNWRVNVPPNVALQHLTKDMAVYFDSSVSPSVTWPFTPLSQAWKYAKKAFKLETLSEPGSQFLYVVLGKFKKQQYIGSVVYQKSFSFRSLESGHRNIIDSSLRERNGWATENSGNFERLFSGLGNIVQIAMGGVEDNADKKLCDSDLRNTVIYDIYIHLKGQESADVVQYKARQFDRTLKLGKCNCFRDWFLPVYEKYGGATVLKNYFEIFKMNWPKNRRGVSKFMNVSYTNLNVGEFVHFWSGAAGEDLRYLAKSAFNNWGDIFMTQFAKAQADFPNITYPGANMPINIRNDVNLNYKSKSSSHYTRSVEGYNKSKNKKN